MQPSSTGPTFSVPLTPTRRIYTGVDKLILAAYMEESAAAAAVAAASHQHHHQQQQQQQQQQHHHHQQQQHYHHHHLDHNGHFLSGNSSSGGSSNNSNFYQQANHYMPSGRGIGYYGSDSSTYKQIPTPTTKSELDLYHLLERANLLNYFGTFLNFGGDDVQQLCDADEDEFLEIMSLVGMTQKPLHVRRLQKALVEWSDNKEIAVENSSLGSHVSCNMNRQSLALLSANSRPAMMADSSWPSQMGSVSNNPTVARNTPEQRNRVRSPPKANTNFTVNTTNINFNAENVNLSSRATNRVQQPLCFPLQITKPVPQPQQPLRPEQLLQPSSQEEQVQHLAESPQQVQPSYSAPYEIFRGAPKRPRLMDDLHRKLSSQEHPSSVLNSSRASSTNPPSPIQRSNKNALTPPQDDEISDEDDDQFEGEEDEPERDQDSQEQPESNDTSRT